MMEYWNPFQSSWTNPAKTHAGQAVLTRPIRLRNERGTNIV
jgi:hypothetical protein